MGSRAETRWRVAALTVHGAHDNQLYIAMRTVLAVTMRTSLTQSISLLLALTTLLDALPAQGSERVMLVGACTHPDSSVWADAEVHCVSNRLTRIAAGRSREGDLDEVVVTSDARGRFRAALLPGRPYSVWAVTPAAKATDSNSQESANGRLLASGVTEAVFAGSSLRIVAQLAPRLRRCRVVRETKDDVLDAAKILLVPATDNYHEVTLALAADGTIALPALPIAPLRLECRSTDGNLLALREVATKEVDTEELNWVMEQREAREVSVQDEAGNSIADAAVFVRPLLTRPKTSKDPLEDWNHERLWWQVARSDSKGKVRFVPPADHVDITLIMAPGYRPAFHTIDESEPVKLVKEPTTKLRLVYGATPLAGATVLALSNDPAPRKIGDLDVMQTVDMQPRLHVTDSDGYVDIPGRPNVRLELVIDSTVADAIDAAQSAARSQGQGEQTKNLRTIHLGTATTIHDSGARATTLSAATDDASQKTIDIAALAWKRITVLAPDGSALAYPMVSVLDCREDGHKPGVVYRGDRRGQVVIGLPAADYFVLAVAQGVGFCEGTIAKSEPMLELKLAPFTSMLVRVANNKNEVVQGARVYVSGQWWQRQLRFFRQVSSWNAEALTLTCDDEGKSRVDLLPWPGIVYSVRAADALGQRRLEVTNNLSTDRLPEVLELTLPDR